VSEVPTLGVERVGSTALSSKVQFSNCSFMAHFHLPVVSSRQSITH
jgi:hypothetical protein